MTMSSRRVGEAFESKGEQRRDSARVIRSRRFGAPSRLPEDLAEQLPSREVGYDAQVAYAMSVMSAWAYSDRHTLERKLGYYGIPSSRVQEVSVRNDALLVAATAFLVRSRTGRAAFVVFRGTEPANAINWLTDADVEQRPFCGGLVHRGFHANLEALWTELVEALDACLAPSEGLAPAEALHLAGHSLGGAMAVIAAARLQDEPTHPLLARLRGVYTYGQPAVGNSAFAEWCDHHFGDRHFRHEFARDVVPHLPPAWGDRYRHSGAVRVSRKQGAAWRPAPVDTSLAWGPLGALASVGASFVARRIPLLARADLRYSIDDHSPARYIEASKASVVPGEPKEHP